MTQDREEEVSAAGRQNGASHTWGGDGLQAVVNIARVHRKPARGSGFQTVAGNPQVHYRSETCGNPPAGSRVPQSGQFTGWDL